MAKQVRYCEPPYNSVPVLILVLFGLYRPQIAVGHTKLCLRTAPLGQKHKEPNATWDRTHDRLCHRDKAWHLGYDDSSDTGHDC